MRTVRTYVKIYCIWLQLHQPEAERGDTAAKSSQTRLGSGRVPKWRSAASFAMTRPVSSQLPECRLCEVRGPMLRVSMGLKFSQARGASGGVCPPAHLGRIDFVLYPAEAEAQNA